MPIYEYECLDKKGCGKVFKHFAKTTTDILTECECCGAPVRRVMSQVYSNFSAWIPSRNENLAWVLSDEDGKHTVDPKKLPSKAFREV